MASLYEISTVSHIDAVKVAINLLNKGAEHFADQPDALAEILAFQLAPDMAPFTFQIWSVRHHSLNATKGIVEGGFTVPAPIPETDYQGYIQILEETLSELETYSEEQVNNASGKAVIFSMNGRETPFTAENFAISFSLPNLYFHLTTLYDVLRMKGVPLGKGNFLSLRVGAPQ